LLFSGIPPRLYLFIGIFIGIILVVQILSLDTMTVGFFTDLIGDDAPLFLTYLLLVFIVMILTEFFSNTVVATAFMPVAATLALTTGGNPLAMMIAVSCACTCTFMTPIATPSNALAFAEMDGISLKKMMLIGIIMNVVAALIMSAYLPGAVEMVYGG
jgi:sodium-dependent dicarboxylate transporter 2/3/5